VIEVAAQGRIVSQIAMIVIGRGSADIADTVRGATVTVIVTIEVTGIGRGRDLWIGPVGGEGRGQEAPAGTSTGVTSQLNGAGRRTVAENIVRIEERETQTTIADVDLLFAS
jgi:hypothetical protein